MSKLSFLTSSILLTLSSSYAIAEQACTPEPEINYTASGIPLLETNPGAPVVLYLDFDGGMYGSSNLIEMSGFNRSSSENSDGDPLTFDATEQKDIINAVRNTDEYFAMFDVNVTTDPAVRDASPKRAWQLITEDSMGGQAHLSNSAISELTNAKAYAAAHRSHTEHYNKNRTIASEFGHNFLLRHQGEYVDGDFIKLVNYQGFDGRRGAIMGSGGGIVNGWRKGPHDGPNGDQEEQDDIAKIQQRILALVPENYTGDGFRIDDHQQLHDTSASQFCLTPEQTLQAKGILERTDDKDTFMVNWQGGTMHVLSKSVGVSAVDVIMRIFDSNNQLLAEANSDNITSEYTKVLDLAAGQYYIDVMSHGGYGELGAYQLTVVDDSMAPDETGGRIEVQITASSDDVEEEQDGYISRSSSDLELVRDQFNQTVGLHFRNLNIPTGATVNNAYLQFQADETDNEETQLTIRGDLSSTTVGFVKSDYNVTSRQLTQAQVNWSPAPWLVRGERDEPQRSTNIAAIIQELIEQNTWIPGNDIILTISGTGKRVAESFDGSITGAPTLIVEYGDYEAPVEVPAEDDGEGDIIEDPVDKPISDPANSTVTAVIALGADDAEQNSTGYISQSSSDLDLGDKQIAGLRFTKVQVPQYATITNAYIQFTADANDSKATQLNIAAELTGHATHISKTAFDLTQRALMETQVNWQPESWQAGEATEAQRTPDLSSLLQPIVEHTDWVEGNAVAFVISGTGERAATSFNGLLGAAPKLVIEFAAPETAALHTLTYNINAGADDAEESATGGMSFGSSDIELVQDGTTQVVGLRFNDINLPTGAEIVDARLQFQADETDAGATNLTITAELTDNAAAFSNTAFNVSSRTPTQSAVNWQVSAWRNKLDMGADQLSPNIAAVINEALSQNTVNADKSIAIIIEGSGQRVATSFNNNPAGAAKLIIKHK